MKIFCSKVLFINKRLLYLYQITKQKNRIMLHTKEFYEIMDAFEKTSKNFLRTGHQGLKREEKENWHRGWYYSDGMANEAFKVFLQGVSFGKMYYRD